MIEELLKDNRERMSKSVDATRNEFSGVRTGRASPHLLDRIEVEYYGTKAPLKQVASVSASEARLLTVTPFDHSVIAEIEKGIQESDLGLTPSNDGHVIRISIPELTEERRKEQLKIVRGLAEDGRVAVRNIRRDTLNDLRELKEAGEVSSDDEHRAEADLQKETDRQIAEIDKLLKGKEEEILEV